MLRRMIIGLSVVTLAACGSSTSSPTGPGGTGGSNSPSAFAAGTLSLTASPIGPDAIKWITALGHLNPPQHTLPTDHIYFYVANPNAGESPVTLRTPFFAPGNGTVTFVLGGGAGQESKVMFRQTSTFSYYIDHVILDAAIGVGSTVTAGQRIGTSGSAYAVDLGVINDTLTVPFLVPSRYTNSDSLHADAPLKYFSEPLRSQLYARVQRLGPDLDGTIAYDIAGRLSGNWFSAVDASPISFAYDTYDPNRVLISVGSGFIPGVFSIAATDPLPRNVSVATGRLLYTAIRTQSGPGAALTGSPVYWLVQMTDDTHIRTEVSITPLSEFTSAARNWAR